MIVLFSKLQNSLKNQHEKESYSGIIIILSGRRDGQDVFNAPEQMTEGRETSLDLRNPLLES